MNWKIGVAVVLFPVGLAVIGLSVRACNYANRAVAVAAAEVDPAYLLKKYSWFKDASAALDKKMADIKVYETRVKAIQSSPDLTRADKEQMYIWMSEVAGVKASYNTLASEYNAQMSKINWAFCNVGELPKGATQPLPREYKPYIEE